jgi:hypothetical protein
VVEWLAVLLRIPGVPGSNLGPGDPEGFRSFPQSLKANAVTVP